MNSEVGILYMPTRPLPISADHRSMATGGIVRTSSVFDNQQGCAAYRLR